MRKYCLGGGAHLQKGQGVLVVPFRGEKRGLVPLRLFTFLGY